MGTRDIGEARGLLRAKTNLCDNFADRHKWTNQLLSQVWPLTLVPGGPVGLHTHILY